MHLDTRNTDLGTLAAMLREQHTRKVDAVVPATALSAENGLIGLTGADPLVGADGVTTVDGLYRPTDIAVGHLADRFGIPPSYLRKLAETRLDLFDANVNGWIDGGLRMTPEGGMAGEYPADSRSFLFRAFRGDDGYGVFRALLSDRYSVIDNIDVLFAALEGLRDAGIAVEIDGCDLTERRMRVRIVVPEVRVMAPVLFAGYRDPFARQRANLRVGDGGGWDYEAARAAAAREGSGFEPGTEPILFGGFELDNSETGGGAFTLVPRAVALACRNGLTFTADAERAVHLGGRLERGVIDWSDDTQRKAVELVRAKTADAARTFTSAEYWRAKVAEIEAKAGREVEAPEQAIKLVGKALSYSDDTQAAILSQFIRGGQPTVGGLLNAVTATAQTVPDADAAAEMEASALRVLDLV